MIKNIIFDFGGVILNIDHKKTEDAFIKLGVKDFDKKYSQASQSQLFDHLEIGMITEDEFLKAIKNIIPHASDEDILNAWNAILLDLPEKRINLLEEVRKNYWTYLISNTNEIHYHRYSQQLRDQYYYDDFSELFDKVYFSFQIAMRKPNKEIFEYVLGENELNPEETLFIDDTEIHLATAASMGMHTYLLKKGKDITDLFDKEGKLKKEIGLEYIKP